MHISVFGLGKLGAPLAAFLGSTGHDVVGVDVESAAVRQLDAGIAPVDEPGLQDLIQAAAGRLRATTDVEKAVHATEVSFVIVPTPSTSEGGFANRHVIDAVRGIGQALRGKDGYHLVVVTSTVMPGSTGGEIRTALEQSSGRRVGDTVGLCYNPEFVALGNVVQGMLRPDVVLIGESDACAGGLLAAIYEQSCAGRPPIERMNFVNAELTKLAVNTFVTTKISYANMLAEVCERLADADVETVTAALGRDSRIGPKYLKGALGYGGPCFPRDNMAFSALARTVGARPDIAEATDRINRHQTRRLEAAVHRRLPSGGTVGILGLAYKPDTAVTEEAAGVAIAATLAKQGYRVIVHDPLALDNARAELDGQVEAASTAAECVRKADLVLITTPWPEYAELPLEMVARSNGRPLAVIDCWRLLPPGAFGAAAEIVHLGAGDPGHVAAAYGRVPPGPDGPQELETGAAARFGGDGS